MSNSFFGAPPQHVYDWALRHETPEERAYRIYAPDSAFEVTVTNGTTFKFSFSRLSGHASATVDWGDGTTSTHTSSPASHTYAAAGKFVVKISDDISTFCVNDYADSRPLVTAALRWGDSVTNTRNTFSGCTKLTGFVPRWGANITDTFRTYYTCISLTGPAAAWGASITNAQATYDTCENLIGPIPPWNDKITNANWAFVRCYKLTGEIPPWGDTIEAAFRTFKACPLLTCKIPKWGAAMKDVGYCYEDSTGLSGAWTDDPAELMPTNIASYENCVIGASAALRAFFYSDWGGTRTKET